MVVRPFVFSLYSLQMDKVMFIIEPTSFYAYVN